MGMAHSTTYLSILLLGMSISFVYGNLLESSARVRRLAPEHEESDMIELWADTVVAFSSQFDTTRYSAQEALGPPDVYPRYGDIPGSWTPLVRNNSQYIRVRFSRAVFLQKVDIYETFDAGGVRRLLARKTGRQWHILYRNDAVTKINSSRIFSPRITIPLESVNELHIHIDCTAGGTANIVEIDAIKIHGYREMVQLWANDVINVSSQYHIPNRFGAHRVLHRPDVYPRYGDVTGAWAQAVGSLNDAQYIEVGFAEALFLRAVGIYETYNGGGVRKLSARMSTDPWQALFHNDRVQKIERSRIFSPRIATPACPVNALRIEVDCTTDGRHTVGIDAIAIYGLKECSQGKWGQCCERSCGKCWENTQCDKSTGNCPKIGASYRCAPAYKGIKCDQECPKDVWDEECKNHCSVDCKHGPSGCDRITGFCTEGCRDGFFGAMHAPKNFTQLWGKDCFLRCSANCLIPTVDASSNGNSEDGNNELPWIGWVVGFAIGMITLAIVVFIIWKCRRTVFRGKNIGSNSSSPNQGRESQSSTVADRTMIPETTHHSTMPLHEVERVVEGAPYSTGMTREVDYSTLDVTTLKESNNYAYFC